jgi:hypothetical protein
MYRAKYDKLIAGPKATKNVFVAFFTYFLMFFTKVISVMSVVTFDVRVLIAVQKVQ